MFFLTEKDAGDLIGKSKILIKKTDYVNDILDKIDLQQQNFKKKFSINLQ